MIADNFKKSNITVIKTPKYGIATNILYLLCINSISHNRDAIFIDSSNIFNPYVISRMARFLGVNQKKPLRHIHVARAFTEYQMEAIVLDLDNIIKQKNPEILAISNLSYDNSTRDSKANKNFEKLIEDIKLVTKSSGIITAISTTGATGLDAYIESKADKILKTEEFNIGDMMGRTVPSFRYHLEEIILELQIFRRALHGEDKIAFDELIEKARKHTSSCSIVPTLDPLNCILLSILIEQQKELKTLKEQNISTG